MKVLHLIPTFGSGGAERQLSILAPALAESGVECHIGYCDEGPNLPPLLGTAVILHRVKAACNHDPRLLWRIWSLIRAVKPDLVQTWLLQMDVLGGAAALLAETPFILSERSSASAYPADWKVSLRSKVGKFASSIVANSQGGMNYWRAIDARIPIRVIRNCIIPVKHALPDVDKSLRASPLIVFAGRLSPEKNVTLLLEALIRVLVAVPECIAFIFGEGPLRVDLRQRISNANMRDRIHMGGYTQNLSEWLSRADVCVSISDFEGNPNVVLEAAARGCPLVLSDIPAHREVFDQSSAWFVAHKSVDDVAEGISHTLQEKEESFARAESAKRVVSNYTLDTILDEYLQIYSEVINLQGRDRDKISGAHEGV